MFRTLLLQLSLLSALALVNSVTAQAMAPAMGCRSCHAKVAGATGVRTVSVEKQLPRDLPRNLYSRHCQNCHSSSSDLQNVSPGHRLAAHFYHHETELLAELGSSEVCVGCHSPGADDWGIDLGDLNPPRFHGSATHPMGSIRTASVSTTGYNVRKQIDRRIRLVEGNVACLSCHALTETTESNLVRFDSAYDLCLGCHVRGVEAGASESLAYFR